jgi:uncharacterized GH25 family protein
MNGNFMRIGKYIFVGCFWITFFNLHAQERWLSTTDYFSKVGDTAVLSWKQGQNLMGNALVVKKEDVTVQIHHKAGLEKSGAFVFEGEQNQLKVPLFNEGTYVVYAQLKRPKNAYSPSEFLRYAEAYGQDETLYYLDPKRNMGLSLIENLTQYVKVFVQAGSTRDSTYKTVLGSSMELIPERNPTQLKVGDTMKVKVMVYGEPKLGVRVKVWNRVSGRSTLQNIYTQRDGCIEFKISSKGVWVIDSLFTEPSHQPEIDFETQHSTLVFGVK